MSETVYNSHGISIDRTESKWTGTTGFSKTNICTLIKAGQTAIMEINETLSYGNGTLGNGNATYGHVLLCGQWSVHQSLNAPNSTIATDDLPPAYSRFPRATSSAEPATYTKTAIRVDDCTVVKPGVRVFQKYIEIVSGREPSSKLVLMLGMAAGLEAERANLNPACPVLDPGYIPTVKVTGSYWHLDQRYLTTTLNA